MILIIKYVNFVVMVNYLIPAVHVLALKVHSRQQLAVFNASSLNTSIIMLNNA